ncbi:MAG: type IV pilus modification protein PilV [Pseudomonadota bacterium]|nr:type IV pilus modification protein PilV [Pseudomonadota bacterium]
MKKHQSGIALLEALIAILVLAIGLMGTIGMQARAYSAMNDASMRAEATMAAERLLGIMAVDQANLTNYAYSGSGTPSASLAGWYGDTRNNIRGATIVVVVTPVAGVNRSAVDITINWLRKAGAQQGKHVVTAYIAQSS